MSSRPELKLDWCSHEAAKYAVEHWHYSRCMPCGKLLKIGVWESVDFIGCVLFGRGANNNLAKSVGLTQTECCELVRIALRKHETPVTRIVALALRFLKQQSPGMRAVISYADPEHGHHGGIYQGGNWIYAGRSNEQAGFVVVNGIELHKRSVSSKFGNARPEYLQTLGISAHYAPNRWKHKYIMPLDEDMRAQIEPLKKPYPKRAGSADGGTPDINQSGGGGSIPTSALT